MRARATRTGDDAEVGPGVLWAPVGPVDVRAAGGGAAPGGAGTGACAGQRGGPGVWVTGRVVVRVMREIRMRRVVIVGEGSGRRALHQSALRGGGELVEVGRGVIDGWPSPPIQGRSPPLIQGGPPGLVHPGGPATDAAAAAAENSLRGAFLQSVVVRGRRIQDLVDVWLLILRGGRRRGGEVNLELDRLQVRAVRGRGALEKVRGACGGYGAAVVGITCVSR